MGGVTNDDRNSPLDLKAGQPGMDPIFVANFARHLEEAGPFAVVVELLDGYIKKDWPREAISRANELLSKVRWYPRFYWNLDKIYPDAPWLRYTPPDTFHPSDVELVWMHDAAWQKAHEISEEERMAASAVLGLHALIQWEGKTHSGVGKCEACKDYFLRKLRAGEQKFCSARCRKRGFRLKRRTAHEGGKQPKAGRRKGQAD